MNAYIRNTWGIDNNRYYVDYILRENVSNSSGECLLFGLLHMGQISSPSFGLGGSVIILSIRENHYLTQISQENKKSLESRGTSQTLQF